MLKIWHPEEFLCSTFANGAMPHSFSLAYIRNGCNYCQIQCHDIGRYRRDNHGQKVQGPSKRNIEINKQITVCEDSRDLCAFIDENAADFNPE
jgi:hypothetical protein